jgi:hypothetical protein
MKSIHIDSFKCTGRRERKKLANSWGVTQSWSSRGGVGSNATSLMQDLYIRKFIFGTFPGVTHVIEQKRGNSIVITFWLKLSAYEFTAPSLSFLVAFSETILSKFLGCNVTIDIRGYFDLPDRKIPKK